MILDDKLAIKFSDKKVEFLVNMELKECIILQFKFHFDIPPAKEGVGKC